jgi:HEAT repeat protein
MLFWTLKKLRSKSLVTREKAVKDLASHHGDRALKALIGATHDEEESVRIAAADLLLARNWPKSPSERANLLIVANRYERAGREEGAAAVPLLARVLQERSRFLAIIRPTTVRRVAEALGYTRDVSAVPTLLKGLTDGALDVDDVARALVNLGRVAVVPLIEALRAASFLENLAATRALGEIGDHRAFGPLASILKEDMGANISRQHEARLALEKLHHPSSSEVIKTYLTKLVQSLRDPANPDRASIIKHLGQTQEPFVLSAILPWLTNNDSRLRGDAEAAAKTIVSQKGIVFSEADITAAVDFLSWGLESQSGAWESKCVLLELLRNYGRFISDEQLDRLASVRDTYVVTRERSFGGYYTEGPWPEFVDTGNPEESRGTHNDEIRLAAKAEIQRRGRPGGAGTARYS